jgi:hypothetical protein
MGLSEFGRLVQLILILTSSSMVMTWSLIQIEFGLIYISKFLEHIFEQKFKLLDYQWIYIHTYIHTHTHTHTHTYIVNIKKIAFKGKHYALLCYIHILLLNTILIFLILYGFKVIFWVIHYQVSMNSNYQD